MFFKKYDFGESSVYFIETPVEGHPKKTTVGMAIYPKGVEVDPKSLCCDSMVQVAFTGDENLIDYTHGVTMRNHNSTLLKVDRQVQFMSGILNTYLSDDKGNEYVHRLYYERETGVFTVSVRYENRSKETRVLEHLSSFSLSGIGSPAANFSCWDMTLHRMTSAWSRECRLKSDKFLDLGLEMSWARYGVKVERWGEVGSMPNRGYYPFAAIESPNGYVLGVQMEAPFSWQMEVYEEKETCALSGGLGDYDFAHWRKEIAPGESFETHKAYFTLQKTLLRACNALVAEQDNRLKTPASEENMPILFNEYCTTWGNPSPAKINRLLKALKGLPIEYFVIDSGWYKPDDKGWCNAIGDWNESKKIFPEGIVAVSKKIREAGMLPGIWFEFEVAGRDSRCFYQEDFLLKRDGYPLTTKNRRFLDLRLPEVKAYLQEKLLRFLKENGFEYLKIDYNDNYGVGCDSPDGAALGEGGRRVAEESVLWFDRIREAIPEIVLENCSSGGSRIEPLRMSKTSMCSFSDAHECPEIPLVAANVSRVIPARQSQIWAVIRKDEPDARTIYSLCAAMFGRICLSGDLHLCAPEKIELIAKGLEFYKMVKEIIRRGEITLIDCNIESYRAPRGRQIYIKDLGKNRLIITHFLECESAVRIPLAGYVLKAAYTDLSYGTRGDNLRIVGQAMHAGAFLLKKEE